MLKIQESFTALLKRTATFFVAENQDSVRDQKEIDGLRQMALEFHREINHPSAERFLAYLLSLNSVEAHYPLHCIRMLALTSRTLTQDQTLAAADLEKYVIAAFFSDIGFRVAWLGSKGRHQDIAPYRLKEMNFAWFTPDLEKLIASHHSTNEDLSPQKILSVISHYLAITQGSGIDQSPAQLLSPTQAMEVLIEQHGPERGAVKSLLKVLSAYPLGSWVELNSGQAGLVLGANPQAPLRPRLGVYQANARSGGSIEEHDLLKEPQLNIARERLPGPLQQKVCDNPQFWIPGWQGAATLSVDELRAAFERDPSAAPPSVTVSGHTLIIDEFWAERTRAVVPSANAAAPEAAKPDSARQVQMDELKSLRSDWERRVLMAEEMVGKLKMGLLESYKRENEKYKALLDKLGAQQSAPAPMPAFPTVAAEINAPAGSASTLAESSFVSVRRDMERALEIGQKQIRRIQDDQRTERNAIQEMFGRARDVMRALHALYADHHAELGTEQDALGDIMERWEANLERLESELFRESPSQPRSVTELELEETAARSLLEEMSRFKGRPLSEDLVNPYTARWKNQNEPALQTKLAAAQKDLIDALHNLSGPRYLVEQLKAEGERLRQVLTSKIVLSYLARGVARREANDNASAQLYFKKAVELKPDFWQAHAFLGLSYLSAKDERAAAEFKAAASANPGHKELEAVLGLTGSSNRSGL